jgi:hypothetical protein
VSDSVGHVPRRRRRLHRRGLAARAPSAVSWRGLPAGWRRRQLRLRMRRGRNAALKSRVARRARRDKALRVAGKVVVQRRPQQAVDAPATATRFLQPSATYCLRRFEHAARPLFLSTSVGEAACESYVALRRRARKCLRASIRAAQRHCVVTDASLAWESVIVTRSSTTSSRRASLAAMAARCFDVAGRMDGGNAGRLHRGVCREIPVLIGVLDDGNTLLILSGDAKRTPGELSGTIAAQIAAALRTALMVEEDPDDPSSAHQVRIATSHVAILELIGPSAGTIADGISSFTPSTGCSVASFRVADGASPSSSTDAASRLLVALPSPKAGVPMDDAQRAVVYQAARRMYRDVVMTFGAFPIGLHEREDLRRQLHWHRDAALGTCRGAELSLWCLDRCASAGLASLKIVSWRSLRYGARVAIVRNGAPVEARLAGLGARLLEAPPRWREQLDQAVPW